MKRPVVLIVGAAAGALLVAAVGASAHTGISLTRMVGAHSAVLSDLASPEPSDSPEPTETPEASPTPEPTEAPEPADNETETGDNNDDQGENNAPAAQATSSDEHDGGSTGGGDGEHGD